MSPANSGSFTSFPAWIPFISFFLLMTTAGTSNPVLSKSGKNERPCPVSDLRGNDFNFSQLNMTLAMGLLCMVLCYVEVCMFHFVGSFNHKWMQIFFQKIFFLVSIDKII